MPRGKKDLSCSVLRLKRHFYSLFLIPDGLIQLHFWEKMRQVPEIEGRKKHIKAYIDSLLNSQNLVMTTSQGPRISLSIKSDITYMTTFWKFIFYTHSTIPQQHSICSLTSKCNYMLVILSIMHLQLFVGKRKKQQHHGVPSRPEFLPPSVPRTQGKTRSLSSKGLQLN